MFRVALVVLMSFALASPAVAGAAPPTLFPSDELTTPDASQATGRRLDLPLPDCARRASDCNEIRLLNELDGFDLDPRVEIAAGRPVDAGRATADNVYLRAVSGGPRIGLNRLVFSPARNTLFGQPVRQLAPATTYELVVTSALTGEGARTTFTTTSATRTLDALRRQLDDGSAYEAAGIGAGDRGLRVERSFEANSVVDMTRFNDTGAGALASEPVLNTARAGAGRYVFGSFLAPQWLDARDRTIEQTPTGGPGPRARRTERVGFALIVPAGPRPEGGYPVAVLGPGITRTKYDVFLAADEFAQRGIATIAIDPVGHSFGPRGELSVRTATAPAGVRLPQFGRAVDVDGDGRLTDREGVQTPGQPHPKAAIALRDGLRQTAVDQMSLVRAIARGADVDGDGSVDLRRSGITYFAVSLGGIYGTQFVATDPQVQVAALNVPGGPILEIARLSPSFRPSVATELRNRVPSLLNGGCEGFTESQPLYADPAVTQPARGAVAIQEVGARVNWLNRSGSPEAYAPAVARERVFYQFAFGDQTVPNPTSANLVRAGDLLDRTTFYRNDRTPSRTMNPHGFLEDPRITGRNLAQRQILEFLASDGRSLVDPDGAGDVFEVPIADPQSLERLNYEFPCLGSNAPPRETAADGGSDAGGRAGNDRSDGLVHLLVSPRRVRTGRTVRLRLRAVTLVGPGRRIQPLRSAVVRYRGRRFRVSRTGRLVLRVRFRRPGRVSVRASSGRLRSDRDVIRVVRTRR